MDYPDHYLNDVVHYLGLTGARSHRSYEAMCKTWINPTEPIPSEQECKNIYDTHIRAAVEAEIAEQEFKQKRRAAYNESGADYESMIEALVEAVIENRPEKLNKLQAKRIEIKTRIPKP